MNSATQALANAAKTGSWAVGMCDQFVAEMFGMSSSGYNTALDNWYAVPSSGKHPNDMNAPAGALMFWGGGQGHVAISDGAGNIYSTDIGGQGTVTKVPASTISSKWGKPYLGWTIPYFQGQSGTTGQLSSTGNGVVSAAGNVTPTSASSSILQGLIDGLIGNTGATDFKDMIERGALILLGGVMIVIAVYKFTAGGKYIPNPVKESSTARKKGVKTTTSEFADAQGRYDRA
jgi:hypothetical protein